MTPADPHQRLREDVSLLGGMLGETLRAREGDAVYEAVERIRLAAKEARQGESHAVPRLEKLLDDLPLPVAVPVARAFSHFLTLANIAEQHHRVRRRRDYARGHAAGAQQGSFDDTLPRLRQSSSADAVYRAVCDMRVALVITAHPTAITRRTLAATHARIARLLDAEDRTDLSAPERGEVLDALRREILVLWGSDDVRRRRPAPMDEVRSGLYVFEQTVWDALPRALRALDRALLDATGLPLPLDAAPIVFGSWIGGDRDGNPAVTAAVTREACAAARALAADLYAREIETLAGELPVTVAIPELVEAAAGTRQPYRTVLGGLAARVRAEGATLDVASIRSTLLLCHRSLVDTGQALIAAGRLTDLLRRVAAFGATLVRLDIRQHSSRHADALDAITRALAPSLTLRWAGGQGAYLEWDEEARQRFLRRAIAERMPLPSTLDATPEVRQVLDTFAAIAAIPDDALGAYVISMTRAPSDVLAVEYLQVVHGSSLRVVPLFEEVATLERAGETMRAIWTERASTASERVGGLAGRSPPVK